VIGTASLPLRPLLKTERWSSMEKNDIPVTIYVTLDDISLIEVEGSGRILSNQLINSDMLLLES